MKKLTIVVSCVLALSAAGMRQVCAQPDSKSAGAAATETTTQVAVIQAPAEAQAVAVDALIPSENVTLDFKEADIRNVLKIISMKAGVNIIATPEVMGNVTIRLVEVPWERALDAILKTYGFAYDKQGNVIIVAPIDKLTAQKRQEVELAQVQPIITEVFNLTYIDAQDARKAIANQLSARGKITVLETTGQAGWEFGSEELAKRKRATEGRVSRSKTMIISDIAPVIDKITEILQKIDVQPQQVLIEARLVEVDRDKLKDIGVTWGTGLGGSTDLTTHRDTATYYVTTTDASGGLVQKAFNQIIDLQTLPLSGKMTKALGGQFLPAADVSEFLFQKLTGSQFEVVLKALEDENYANTLSAPSILTLNNQEASILVGSKYPLIKATVSNDTGAITGQSLDRYQDIGIQLNVVPQISGKDTINLIVHPAVSSYTQTVKAVSSTGVTMAEYPIIIIREAETQILLKDGQTVAIGGLYKDERTDTETGLPFLKDIPILGAAFRRNSTSTDRTELVVFITTRIMKDSDFTVQQVTDLSKHLDRDSKNRVRKYSGK